MLWLLAVSGTAFILILLYGYFTHYHLVTTTYDVESKVHNGEFSFVVLSDLHQCRYLINNKKLIRSIRKQKIDAILIAGDMVNKHTDSSNTKVIRVLDFLRECTEIAPVYYANGNHEIRMTDPESYERAIRDAGCIFLKNTSVLTEDGRIRIYGLDIIKEKYRSKIALTSEEITSLMGVRPENKKEYTVLLAHSPRFFEAYADWGADLTLSGHLHGGIVRLPMIGGILEPGYRLFPRYDSGIFDENGKKMIVSRGLGSHGIIFRFLNPPELVIVHLK